ESVQVLRQNGQYVALLRFVAPDLGRRHPGLFQMDLGQFKNGAAARIVDELGKRVRKPACPDVVDSNNGVLFALLPATINDLLGTALDLGVPALNRIKIQLGAVGTYTHARGRTTTHATSHAWPAQLTQQCAGSNKVCMRQTLINRPRATGDHDGLVVAPACTRSRLLVTKEVAQQVRALEFVIERRASQGAVNSNFERRR